MNDYEARKAAKAERYQQYADNASKRAEGAFGRSREIADMIPFGQPILVGHHSEGRARRDAQRIHDGMRKGIEEQDKAAYWARRAEAVENDTSISRHDPKAVAKLTEKIAELDAQREEIKRYNAAARKGRAGLLDAGYSEALVARAEAATERDWRRPITLAQPPYVLSNLGANIKRYKARLAELSQPVIEREERPRLMYSKRDGPCAACPAPIRRGDFIKWFRERGEAEHNACPQGD
jgi:hypothetical protein